MEINLTFYIVMNAEGLFFRAKGYGGYGETWVADVTKAKVYQKIGQARSRVSFFANTYPGYGVPSILELAVTGTKVLDESIRVAKAAKAKARAELKRKEDHLKWERDTIARKQADLDKDKARLGIK